MDHFEYRDGELYCEEVPVSWIAAEVGTPTYLYSASTLVDHYKRLAEAFAPIDPLICFAVKSCSNINILRLLADLGAGMDVVSGGELHRVKHAGVTGGKIVYAGVGKTSDEIRQALTYSAKAASGLGIRLFNVESEAEFENIDEIARGLNVSCEVALRINPNVAIDTHEYTATGQLGSKFGIDIDHATDFFRKHGHHEHCKLNALHLHLGSPIYTIEPYVEAVTKALALIDELHDLGTEIKTLNLGGGFGADYEAEQSPTADEFAKAIVPLLEDRVKQTGLQIILEPGRTISANAGILLTKVEYVKRAGNKQFIIVDAGMHTLIRPTLYDAFHFIWPISVAPMHVPEQRQADPDIPGLEVCDVVGPICETGDFLARDRRLPMTTRGDLMAVFAAGAYSSTMASRYNSIPLPAEVLVDGSTAMIIRHRETHDHLTELETTTQILEPETARGVS